MRGGKRIIVGPPYGAHERLKAVRRFATRPIWCVLAAVVFGRSVVGDEVDAGVGARTGQGGVGPVAGEGLGTTDDERSVDGGALAPISRTVRRPRLSEPQWFMNGLN